MVLPFPHILLTRYFIVIFVGNKKPVVVRDFTLLLSIIINPTLRLLVKDTVQGTHR